MLHWYCRQELVAPLYQLLNYSLNEKWQSLISDLAIAQAREDGAMPLISIDYIQQLIFINLERLATAILSDTNPDHAVSTLPLSPGDILCRVLFYCVNMVSLVFFFPLVANLVRHRVSCPVGICY